MILSWIGGEKREKHDNNHEKHDNNRSCDKLTKIIYITIKVTTTPRHPPVPVIHVPVIVIISYSEMLESALNFTEHTAWRMNELFSN